MTIYGNLKIVSLALLLLLSAGGGGSSDSASDSSVGQGGSMARFSIVDDYLYTIAGTNLQLFDISNPADPAPFAKVFVDWRVETIFSYQGALFIGAPEGVFIYDNSDPSNPVFSSKFTHATACDPVVVSNNIAYVTLRSGNNCIQGLNQMDILDVTDIYNPQLLNTIAMQIYYTEQEILMKLREFKIYRQHPQH